MKQSWSEVKVACRWPLDPKPQNITAVFKRETIILHTTFKEWARTRLVVKYMEDLNTACVSGTRLHVLAGLNEKGKEQHATRSDMTRCLHSFPFLSETTASSLLHLNEDLDGV